MESRAIGKHMITQTTCLGPQPPPPQLRRLLRLYCWTGEFRLLQPQAMVSPARTTAIRRPAHCRQQRQMLEGAQLMWRSRHTQSLEGVLLAQRSHQLQSLEGALMAPRLLLQPQGLLLRC